MNIIQERLAQLNAGKIKLHQGGHGTFESGHCAMEVVAYLAGLGHTDAPECSSPVLRRYVIRLNDRWDDEQRQKLAPYLPRLVGTAGDGKDEAREQLAMKFLLENQFEKLLRAAGLNAEADQIPALLDKPLTEQRDALWEMRKATYRARRDAQDKLRAKVKAELAKRENPAAVADAVAVADAAAVADAVADADEDPWDTSYTAAYRAARKYYQEHPEVYSSLNELNLPKADDALVLLDQLIMDGQEAK